MLGPPNRYLRPYPKALRSSFTPPSCARNNTVIPAIATQDKKYGVFKIFDSHFIEKKRKQDWKMETDERIQQVQVQCVFPNNIKKSFFEIFFNYELILHPFQAS
ncbi:hypothetical protein [Paenibacillus sp. Soil522]|uniref:hypothetical protein n=1 Tax=Paenibacillus sp. Soil522 TaxID=1736388 RepID=UPI0006FE7342|nr:hypothetical protein [Paenibacillus sp. Soil522]KRE35239.1 hypothetical protein ASG81_21915 [Paenibacillus sp. Soil522]